MGGLYELIHTFFISIKEGIKMKRLFTAMLFLSVLSLPSILYAADPIIGTWKPNHEKSEGTQTARDVIEVYKEIEGNMIEATWTATRKDGSTGVVKKIFPKEGGVAKYIDYEVPENIIVTVIPVGSGDWYISTIMNGRKVQLRHLMVSKDGKTLIKTIKGLNNEGKPVDMRIVLEKQ